MQPDTHPTYNHVKVTCSCGNTFSMGTILSDDMHVELCNKCHPAYTGKRKISSAGAIDKFAQKYSSRMAGFVSAGHGKKAAESDTGSDKPAE